jgi:hypothetical protein
VLAVQTWSRWHGLLTLELHGHLRAIVADPDALFTAEVEHAITLARETAPPN